MHITLHGSGHSNFSYVVVSTTAVKILEMYI